MISTASWPRPRNIMLSTRVSRSAPHIDRCRALPVLAFGVIPRLLARLLTIRKYFASQDMKWVQAEHFGRCHAWHRLSQEAPKASLGCRPLEMALVQA